MRDRWTRPAASGTVRKNSSNTPTPTRDFSRRKALAMPSAATRATAANAWSRAGPSDVGRRSIRIEQVAGPFQEELVGHPARPSGAGLPVDLPGGIARHGRPHCEELASATDRPGPDLARELGRTTQTDRPDAGDLGRVPLDGQCVAFDPTGSDARAKDPPSVRTGAGPWSGSGREWPNEERTGSPRPRPHARGAGPP